MNLSKLLSTLTSSVTVYAPVALGAIASVEAADASIPGPTKAQIAVNIVLAAAQVGEGVPVPAVSDISTLVDVLVGSLNATGIFQHKAQQSAQNSAPAK
jgi:hypothetical protein